MTCVIVPADQAHPVKPCNGYANDAAYRWSVRRLQDIRTLVEREFADWLAR